MAPTAKLKVGVQEQEYVLLGRKRSQLRTKITTTLDAVSKWKTSLTGISLEDARTVERTLVEISDKVETLNAEIKAMLEIPISEEDFAIRDSWEERVEEYAEKIQKALAIADVAKTRLRALEQVKIDESSTSNQSGSQALSQPVAQTQMILPKDLFVRQEKKIPKFGGDAKKFKEWFGLYESAVKECPPLEKFEKLKGCLTGDAWKAIAHLELTEEFYATAIKIIKDEYGSIFSAQYAYGQELIKLCSGKGIQSPDKWHVAIPSISQNIKALQTLVPHFDGTAVLLLPMVLDSLPNSVRESFLRTHEVSNSDEALKQLEALLKFLSKETKIKAIASGSKPSDSSAKREKSFAKGKPPAFGAQKAKDNHAFLGAQAPEGDHSCIFCNGKNHISAKCRKTLTNSERAEIVRSANACAKCLRRNHVAAKCRQKVKCSHCNNAHHALLCTREQPGGTSTMMGTSAPATDRRTEIPEGIKDLTNRITKQANLATGYANIQTEDGWQRRRILLDTGSQRSYITNRLAKILKAPVVERERLINHTLGGQTAEVREYSCYRVNLTSRFAPHIPIPVECLGIPVITSSIFPMAERISGIQNLADDVNDSDSKEIDLLIGTDDMGQIWMNETKSEGRLIAIKTRLGWFTFGRKAPLSPFTNVFCALQSSSQKRAEHRTAEPSESQNKTDRDIEFLFQSELLGVEPPAVDEAAAELQRYDEMFKANIRRNRDGRYRLKFIFNENLQSLGDNERIAFNRLNALISRSSKEVLTAIDEELESYVAKGYAEQAPKRKPGEFAHYLPLQVVKKPDPNSQRGFKLRIVKDAGCRSKDLASLNDVLINGSNLLQNILFVLARFRAAPIAIVADVEKAYHQLEIDPSHRTFLRFYWKPGVSRNSDAPLKEFWSKRLDFGTSASPWLYQAGIKYHLDNEKMRRPKDAEFISDIQQNIYMDDLSFGAINPDRAVELSQRCVEIFESGHFPLKKWATNSKEASERMTSVFSDESVVVRTGESDFKFLGIRWCQVTDSLGVFTENANKAFRDAKPTKRSLLSGLAQIYDPIGIICPITVQARVLFQKMWQDKIQWDDTLVGQHRELYGDFIKQLRAADHILVKRSNAKINRMPRRTEIHAFSDASKYAYGAVIYLREFFDDGKPEIKFLMAKAKVAPNKSQWNIHRLELMGALVSCRLVQRLRPALGNSVKRTFYWVDNSAVVAWTREKPSAWKTFVANRVAEIQLHSTPDQWQYVSTKSNPADMLSRGCSLDSEELVRFWLEGPDWLRQAKLPAPVRIGKAEFDQAIAEARVGNIAAVNVLHTTSTSRATSSLLKERHFSSWPKAVRAIAYCKRYFQKRILKEKLILSSPIQAAEYFDAERVLLRDLQRADFPSEVASGGARLARSSKLYLYNPFLDDQGILRCRSRLEMSGDLSFGEKFPIILNGRNYFVRLLIAWIHKNKCLHSPGITTNLHHVRTEYLILRARSTTMKVLKECRVCAKFRAKPAGEVVPPLPAFRIEEAKCFEFTGCDFAGPIMVRDDEGKKSKAYIVLFVCAVSRAIYLELTPDLTTFEFLLVLRKFINRHPAVRRIISDNGSTFKRAEKELELAHNNIRNAETQKFLAETQVRWEFITDRAPTQGAWWERCVQLVKRPLRKILGTNVPRFRELESILSEIEMCVNLRPISALTSSDCEVRALCPADLVNGYNAKSRFPDTSVVAMPTSKRDQPILAQQVWKRQESIMNGFWKRFRIEYLTQLRGAIETRPAPAVPLSVGDIVLISDPSPSRSFWPLAKIVNLFGGERTDLRKRSCMVRLENGKIVKRPISMIYPIGINENDQ